MHFKNEALAPVRVDRYQRHESAAEGEKTAMRNRPPD